MNRRREKLINAIIFFAGTTNYCGKTKLMKLLSFFEFEHVNQTGLPPIGLGYYAYQQGPLAFDLWLEIGQDYLTSDFADKLETKDVTYPDGNKGILYLVKPGIETNMKVFSPREEKILLSLVEKYKDATASEMSKISHQEDQPWYTTIKEKGEKQLIDYVSAMQDRTPEELKFAAEELAEYFAINSFLETEPTEPQW